LAAAAKTYGGTAGQSEGLSFGVDELEIAFDAERPVVIYGDFGCRQFILLGSSLHHTALPCANFMRLSRMRLYLYSRRL
jgi:hypothetical protein